MRVTVGGTRLVSDWKTGAVASGAKYFRTSTLLPKARVVWNGNPFCEPGCVLYLPGIEGTGATIYDYSGQKNNGTITQAIWKRLPSGLWYLDFDGIDDKIRIAHNATFNFTTAFTLEAWVNIDAFHATEDGCSFIVKDYNGTNVPFVLFHQNVNPGDFGAFNGFAVGFYDTAWRIASVGSNASLDTWYQVVGTFSRPTLIIYVNGVSLGTGTRDADTPNNNNPLDIGEAGTWGAFSNIYPLNGFIALPRIYNRALSALEIQNHYQQERHLFNV